MKRLWLGAALLALLGVYALGAPSQGFTIECVDNACQAEAATAPLGLVASLVTIVIALLYRRQAVHVRVDEAVKVVRRIGAFVIDFMGVVFAVTPLVTLPFLLIEAGHTGAFAWSFERDFARSTDGFAILGVLLMLGALAGYFYGHAKTGRQTIGQYLLGFSVAATGPGAAKPALNTALAVVGFCLWPISVWLAARRPDKAFWWNLRTGFHAQRLTYEPDGRSPTPR